MQESNYSVLPFSINGLSHDIEVFKPALKDYILFHSYSVEEFSSVEKTIEYCQYLCK
jgi:hypothetical protein